MANATPMAVRFWAKVQKDGPIPPSRPDLGPCWIWTAAVISAGYGSIAAPGVKRTYAHRYAYEQLVGPIPTGLHLDHLCRVTRCVNPGHLEPVTPAVNKLRGVSPNAINARKTHCKYGHEFTDANTYIRRKGTRDCRACNRRRARENWDRGKRR